MLAAGNCLADFVEQIKAIAAMNLPPPRARQGGAEQEQENAGNLRQEAPARATSPAPTGLDRLPTPWTVIAWKESFK